MQALVEGLEGEGTAPLGLGADAARAGGAALQQVVVVAARRGGDVGGGEGSAYAYGDEGAEDLVREGGDDGLGGPGEELGEGEGLARVAAHRGRLRGVQVGEHGLEEAQVRPAGDEAGQSQQEGGDRQQRRQRKHGNDAEVEEREARDAQRQDALEQRDGVRGDELAEGDEEGDL